MATHKNNTCTCHFITQTNETYNSSSVIFYSLVNISNNKVTVGNNIDELLGSIIEQHITKIYFHDFNYEMSYIQDYILKNNFVYHHPVSSIDNFNYKGQFAYDLFRDNTGHLYYIKLFIKLSNGVKTTCELRSSHNKTMSSVLDMYNSYKININSNNIKNEYLVDNCIQLKYNETPNDYMLENCIIYCMILASVLKTLINNSMTKLTIGSDAIKEWTKLDGDFEPLLPKIDSDLEYKFRQAYRGGFTWLNKNFANKDLYDGIVLDINSLYPYVMKEFNLPYKQPKRVDYIPEGFDTLFICCVICHAKLKNNMIPCISRLNASNNEKGIVDNEYLEYIDGLELWLTNFDINLLQTSYDIIDIQLKECYIFESTFGMFNNFIDKHYKIKKNSSGAQRELSKLMLDSLYGRFGIKRDKKMSIPYIENNIVKYKDGDLLKDKTINYVPLSCFITSIARWYMINLALEIGVNNIIYMDTDSIHINGLDLPQDCPISSELGDFKIEAVFKKARYIGLKTYIHDEYSINNRYSVNYSIDKNNIVTIVKMCGAPDTVKQNINWTNFNKDTIVFGKPFIKPVEGGNIRLYTTYRICNCVN